MKRNRTIALLGLALAALAMAQDPITLRRDLKPQSKDVYKVNADTKTLMDIPSMGEQEMIVKSTMTYAMATDKVADGKADLALTVSDIDYKMEGAMADMMGAAPPMPKEMKFKGKIDARNRISDVKFDGKMDMMTMMMTSVTSTMSLFIEFPEAPVKLGDSWDVVIPKNPLIGNEDSKFKATLVGEKDGKWQLKMTGELKIKNDMSEMMKGQDPTGAGLDMQMVITGLMKMECESLVDKATGRTLEMTTKTESNTTTDIVNMGIKSDQKAKGTIKMVLQS